MEKIIEQSMDLIRSAQAMNELCINSLKQNQCEVNCVLYGLNELKKKLDELRVNIETLPFI